MKKGQKKKPKKKPLRERKRERFFNQLQKRGINSDKEHHHKTNVQYTGAQKKITNFKKTESEFINQLVKKFEATT